LGEIFFKTVLKISADTGLRIEAVQIFIIGFIFCVFIHAEEPAITLQKINTNQ